MFHAQDLEIAVIQCHDFLLLRVLETPPADLSFPVRPGQSGGGEIHQRSAGLVSGGAQEHGLLWLRPTTFTHCGGRQKASLVRLHVYPSHDLFSWYNLFREIRWRTLNVLSQVCGTGPCSCSCDRQQVHPPQWAEEVHGHSVRPACLPREWRVTQIRSTKQTGEALWPPTITIYLFCVFSKYSFNK